MGAYKDLTGMKFNRLTVLKKSDKKIRGKISWDCKCDCGNYTTVDTYKLKSGHTKSCGCLNGENRKRHIQNLTTHNKTHTKLFEVWVSMRSRCYNSSNKSYAYYGGRGIFVADEWLGKDGFESFYRWSMSNGYRNGLSIDRIDNNRGYSPENCRWVDTKTQCNNRRNNIRVEYLGKHYTSIAELARECGVDYHRLRYRLIEKGTIPEDAIEELKK